MDWLELHIDTAHAGLETVEAALSALGIDGVVIDDETEFQDFLKENRQYWDYVDENLSAAMAGKSRITFYLPADETGFSQLGQVRLALEQLKEELGLNDPILVRYVRMMKGMFVDESGAVSDIIFKMKVFLPNSLKLCFTALAISVVLALPLGIIAAVKQNTLFDGACMVVSLVGVSMPNFWLALILMIVFALNLGWFPTSGSTEPIHIVLPAATLAFINKFPWR